VQLAAGNDASGRDAAPVFRFAPAPHAVIGVTDWRRPRVLDNCMAAAAETVDAGVLFETYHDRIYRYVLGLVRNPAEAEDLTQDTFLRAHRYGDSLRDPAVVRGWLYRIATHVCLDRLRQCKPVVSLDSEEAEGRIKPPVSDSPSPLDVSERKETSACVQRCLDFLPDKYRAVILLHEAHSLTAQEIADLLGVTVATVKIRLHRARRGLQQVMERGCAVSTDKRGTPTCHPKS
jgi:RNA polymerase sigma-70 factor, ECF subfamily